MYRTNCMIYNFRLIRALKFQRVIKLKLAHVIRLCVKCKRPMCGATMMVRRYKRIDEIERLRKLAFDDHMESVFHFIPFSDRKFDAYAERVVSNPNHSAIIVADSEDDIFGFAMCSVGEYFIGERVLVTTVTVLYVRPIYRISLLGGKIVLKIVKAIIGWSESVGSARVIFHVTSGVKMKESDQMFRKLGGRTLGGNYLFSIGGADG